ncbi:MAG TPA: DUF192 domain-containing protein [Elusimicrobiota bacterium]|jgi:hypothetical protein|nr:DUF192 domain-containing protein [Elusimicrobiota bacterium]
MKLAAFALCLALTASAAAAPASAAPGSSPSECTPQKVATKARLRFPGGASIRANVVDTPQSREIGMMCLTKLPRDYGMLFVFPQEMDLNFWMKNTLVSIDMVWIGADKRVTVVHPRMKKSTVDTPDDKVAVAGGRGQYVLELPAGAAARDKLKAGAKIGFDVSIPDK